MSTRAGKPIVVGGPLFAKAVRQPCAAFAGLVYTSCVTEATVRWSR